MSLLMDALKRAERAREAKERDGEDTATQNRAPGPALSLDPVDGESTNAGGLALEPVIGGDTGADLQLTSIESLSGGTPVTRNPADTIDLEDSGTLSLDLGPEDTGTDYTAPPRPPPAHGVEDPGDVRLPPIFLGERDAQAEDTSATLPSLKAVQASVDSYFDGTDSISVSMERPTPPDYVEDTNTTMTGKRLGEEVEAQLAAQRVFDSKPPAMPSSGRSSRVLVLVILPLFLLVGAGTSFWFWFESTQTPAVVQRGGPNSASFMDTLLGLFSPPSVVPRSGTVPRPARTVGTAPATGLATAGVAQTAAGNGGATSNAQLLELMLQRKLAEMAASAKQVEAEVAARGSEALQAGTVAIEQDGEKPFDPATPVPAEGNLSVQPPEPKIVEAPTPAPAPAVEPARPEPNLSDQQFQQAVRQTEERLPTSAPEPGTISIQKANQEDLTQSILSRAFKAYEKGQFSAARRAYEAALRRQPTNRNAILGAAAAAANTGDVAEAAQLYRFALDLNPKDSFAHAALTGLTPSGDVQTREAELLHLIAAEPTASHLHYSLGNLYAEIERWPEAQAAYFDASRHDASNPDYAFNLAVSLEHMSQKPAALDYYRRSVELARDRGAGFDVNQAQLRIASMAGNQ
jgi:tetratricopeptide (TPR) repeat protein